MKAEKQMGKVEESQVSSARAGRTLPGKRGEKTWLESTFSNSGTDNGYVTVAWNADHV